MLPKRTFWGKVTTLGHYGTVSALNVVGAERKRKCNEGRTIESQEGLNCEQFMIVEQIKEQSP